MAAYVAGGKENCVMRKIGVLACALALSLAALVACSGDSSTSDSKGDAAGAGQQGGAQPIKDVGEFSKAISKAQHRHKSAKIKLDMRAGQQGSITGNGSIRQDADAVAMNMTMRVPDGELEMTVVDESLYLKLPEEQAPEPGKPWVRIDPRGKDQMSQVFGEMISSMRESTDISKFLDSARDSAKITDTEPAKLNGEQVRRYHIVVDVRKLAKSHPDPNSRKAMEQSVQQGLAELPQDIWVNSDNLPVRYGMDIPMQGQKISASVDFTNWGEPVRISAPPRDQIGKAPELPRQPQPTN
ncbi:MAG: hypothetical protein GEU98_16335 [Pseudonocardiaceae bacterium]|nr:hypothetical protein [Pseudonocardiaceae bacterium]